MSNFHFIRRMLREIDGRILFKFCYNFGWKGMRSVEHFKQRLKKGVYFPAFLFISPTNACNLRCQGCWVLGSERKHMAPETLDAIIAEGKRKGCWFYGILGGEPLMHQGLLDVLERHPACYFQLFTNGTLMNDDIAARLRRMGHVTPLISIEGLAEVSDTRRGGKDVFERTMNGLEACRKARLVIGAATSVCKSNFNDLVSMDYLQRLVDRGVHYMWYYIYRPVGPNPEPDLALSHEEIVALRRFIVDARCKAPLIIVDAYWDHLGRGLCPAAVGISYHINPAGFIEPCPPIQFALDQLGPGVSIEDLITRSSFYRDFSAMVTETTQGCILLENPAKLKAFLEDHQAIDSSGRGTGYDELAAMKARASHAMPGAEIPEKNHWYRWAKKNWFFGFGAYG